MTRKAVLGVILALCPVALWGAEIKVFRPFEARGYAHVNAHHFSPDGSLLYLAMFPERVASERGESVPDGSPEVSIYVARSDGSGGWSAPEPISFAGRHKDYEPTLSPDGSVMLFNSWRPMPDGTPITNGKNNLWLSHKREGGGWSEPVMLEGVSKLETEESYPTIASDGRVYYGQETLDADGETGRYDIYTGRLEGDRLVEVRPFGPGATEDGEGDPWVSPDGNLLLFTRWESGGDWSQTADLYMTRRKDGAWSEPEPFPFNDPTGPDFSPTASADGATFYWKQPGGTKMMPMDSLRR